ncbi:MAG: Orf 15 [Parcubacteria group bacterium GW2011_GWF2_50_9]|nr:MAG: Orf 15 [Parcubacteria group bacterium GW2011_GWF2_50_9]
MAGFEIIFEAIDQASPAIQRLSQQLLDAAQRSDTFAGVIEKTTARADKAFAALPPKVDATAQSMTAVQGAANQLMNQLAGFATVAGIAAFFKSTAEAALTEEEALRRLQFAVEATGGSFGKEKERIVAFAQEQQALTRFSDTETYDALGRLTRITGDAGQAMQGTKLAFGLASASGKDLNHILELLGPILNGDASRMRALKTEFGAFIGDASTSQEVIDALAKKFTGAAEKESGFAMQLASLRNRLDDFKEIVGAGVLPVFKVFLEGILKGAQLFESLGVVIANWGAKAMVIIEQTASGWAAIFKGQFDRLPEIVQDANVKMQAIEEASTEQAAEVQRRYANERQGMITQEVELKTQVTQKSIEESQKEADEKKRQGQDAYDKLTQLEAERLESEGQNLESRLLLIEQEKTQRFQMFEELRNKGLITEDELMAARLNASAISIAESQKAREAINADLIAVRDTQKAVSDAFASSFSGAVADMIMEGKSFEDAWKAVMNTVLRTAIETFTRVAVERAMANSAVSAGSAAGGMGGGLLAAGFMAVAPSISKGLKKIFGFAEGAIVTKPVLATIAENGPEAVIPLNRLGDFGGGVSVSVIQHNTINVTGVGDEQVRQLMRRISEVTRSGAAEGAELVKSMLSKQGRLSKDAV